MLRLSHVQNITDKLSKIDSINELEAYDKQLYSLLSKHYTRFVGVDVSQEVFSIDVKKANCETLYIDEYKNHHDGFCKLMETFNALNEQKVSVLIYNILKYNRKYYRNKDDYKAYRASPA